MVYVFFADGFEEVEALTSVDLVRRSGEELKMVSIMGRKTVYGAHGINIEADILFEELIELEGTADMLVLPGGMPGTKNLGAHEGLKQLLKKQYEMGGWLAAICAAPSVFAANGFLEGRNATSYPGWLKDDDCKAYLEEEVVVDGKIITSRGVGTAIPFALKLIEILKGDEVAKQIAASIIYRN